MILKRKKEFMAILAGDLAVFCISLYLTLVIRNLGIPENNLFFEHTVPFSMLFMVWIVVFFIAGLYERRILLIKSKLPSRLISAHFFNIVIAIIFFYSIPYFGISPKIVLFLYLLISSIILFFWRIYIYTKVASGTRERVIMIAEGHEVDDLLERLSHRNSLVEVSKQINPSDLLSSDAKTVESFLMTELQEFKTNTIVIDVSGAKIQDIQSILYQLMFKGVQFIDFHDLYEETTGKVPLSHIDEVWFLKNASLDKDFIYTSIKRLMDIVISLPLFILSLIFYPFVWMGMRLEGKGSMFYTPERVGQSGRLIKLYKFRTMTIMDSGNQLGQNQNKITRLGKIMRVTRIDELPQLWNILKGDMSLIGPRPEFPTLVDLYDREIPHYNVRHLIKPGLSGWAQIHHEKPPHTIEETYEKLAYDIYYIKNRSLWLDLKIALQTIKTLLSRVGV
jgi:exopolysaccharide biosynthesis polyprenyl glycosylphosphotransferase